MPFSRTTFVFVVFAIIPLGGIVQAETTLPDSAPGTQPAEKETTEEEKTKEQAGTPEAFLKNRTVSEHEILIDGQPLHYRTTAAKMPLKDDQEKLKAHMFFVAYEKLIEDKNNTDKQTDNKTSYTQPDTAQRPITFVFNGGPGAAAVFLHLGAAGPKRIQLGPKGMAPAPPFKLKDNPHTWLKVTDLVFIDPVGTGYSRPANDVEGKEFYGVKQDIQSVAEFIRLYATLYNRWLSPHFLAGESYGTTRAAGLSSYLLERYGIPLNGIIFISSVLDFQTIVADRGQGNDLPYALYLPSYTATAFYHHRLTDNLQADLEKTLAEVEDWVTNVYTVALAKGNSLDNSQRQEIARTLSRYTSLPVDFILQSNLRIRPGDFRQRLLRDEQLLIGRFDSRVTGFNPEPTAGWPPYDPSGERYFAIYSSTFNDYIRRELDYRSTLIYEVLSPRVRPWEWESGGLQGYLSVSDNLRSAMTINPDLQVFFASGFFDLATPFFATDYTINRLDLSPQMRANIRNTRYRSGHMIYHNPASLKRLTKNISEFIQAATANNK